MFNLTEDPNIPENLEQNAGRSVLILTGDDAQDLEFFYPFYRLAEAGVKVDVATAKGGKLTCKNGLGIASTDAITSLSPSDYDLLYLPGGKAPASMRKDKNIISFITEFAASGKPIAAICHGPQLLVTANLVRDKRLAAWPEVESEIEDAGGTFVNKPLVEDGQFITARRPGDLPGHLAAILARLGLSGRSQVNKAA